MAADIGEAAVEVTGSCAEVTRASPVPRIRFRKLPREGNNKKREEVIAIGLQSRQGSTTAACARPPTARSSNIPSFFQIVGGNG